MVVKNVLIIFLLISLIANVIFSILLFYNPASSSQVSEIKLCIINSDCDEGFVCEQDILCQENGRNCVSAKYCREKVEVKNEESPVCGNEVCESGENCNSCSEDCGKCIETESCETNTECRTIFNENWRCVQGSCYCPESDSFIPVCGVNGRTYSNPQAAECAGVEYSNGACDVVCGNGVCEAGEANKEDCGSQAGCSDNKDYCPKDCVNIISSVCGDGICEGEEGEEVLCGAIICPFNCPKDCGNNLYPVCGNGICESGESQKEFCGSQAGCIDNEYYCPKDCENTVSVTGNCQILSEDNCYEIGKECPSGYYCSLYGGPHGRCIPEGCPELCPGCQ